MRRRRLRSDRAWLEEALDMPAGDRLCLAYHEAGHAVAARILGVKVLYVTIRPDARLRRYGQCHVDGFESLDESVKDAALAAADVAVKLHLGFDEEFHRHSFANGDAGDKAYAAAKAQAAELLDTTPARAEVRELAESLLRWHTMRSDEALYGHWARGSGC